jgi:hypothetical protein
MGSKAMLALKDKRFVWDEGLAEATNSWDRHSLVCLFFSDFPPSGRRNFSIHF